MLFEVTFSDGTTRTLQAHNKKQLEEALSHVRLVKEKGIRFVPDGISITAHDETRLATGIVGEGTGLGYYQIAEGGYVLVHVQSGTKLGTNAVQTQAQAQQWLELVAQLTDWNRTVQELRTDPNNTALQVEIAQAWAKVTGRI